MGKITKLAALIIAVAISGPLIWSMIFNENHDFIISVTAFAIGTITFFGIAEIYKDSTTNSFIGGEKLRTAIACSLVVTYLFIVSFAAFVYTGDNAGLVTREMMTSFSNVIGITIAFFFGASAAETVFSTKDKNEKDNES